ncbi:MAG: DUF2157 domain-containing protein [Gammaproteobacteria bacterium]
MDASHGSAVGLAETNTLRDAGLLSAERYLDAAWRVRAADDWTAWARHALLALGAGHLLAGIIFFFAYNWDDLPVLAKFALVEAGIIISAVSAFLLGMDRPAGQALLIGASVLTGVLLAVIGQVYQTGADAYELFATWVLLILPWTLASRSAAHWLVWLIVTYLAIGLYGLQVLIPADRLTETDLLVILGAVSAALLAARELACRSGAPWLAARWTRLVPAFATLLFTFLPAIEYVIGEMLFLEGESHGMIAFFAVLAAAASVYAKLHRDYAVTALATGFSALFLMAAGGRLLGEAIGFDDILQILVMLGLLVAWCALVTGGAVRLLSALHTRMGAGTGG